MPERDLTRRVRAELGAALRDARARRGVQAAVATPLEVRPLPRARRPWRLAVVIAGAALALTVIALLPPATVEAPTGGDPAPQEPPAATAEPIAELSRGRSITADEVAAGTPRPRRTAPPRRTPRPTAGVPGGAGGGGSGGGSGGGTASPEPTVVTQTRFFGRVIDASTGKGIPGVCVAIGLRECEENPVYTDRSGAFSITLPAPGTWDLNFVHERYVSAYRRVSSDDEPSVSLGVISLQPQ